MDLVDYVIKSIRSSYEDVLYIPSSSVMVYGYIAKLISQIAVTCLNFLIFISFWIVRYPHGENRSVIDVSLKQPGYLVILNIPEQFISAVDDFVQLYMVNQIHWKLRMIEPYVLGSRIAFVPPVEEDFRSLPVLSTYFNRSHMLHNLKRCFHSEVEFDNFQDFLINAARAFIVLKFVIKLRVRFFFLMKIYISVTLGWTKQRIF